MAFIFGTLLLLLLLHATHKRRIKLYEEECGQTYWHNSLIVSDQYLVQICIYSSLRFFFTSLMIYCTREFFGVYVTLTEVSSEHQSLFRHRRLTPNPSLNKIPSSSS